MYQNVTNAKPCASILRERMSARIIIMDAVKNINAGIKQGGGTSRGGNLVGGGDDKDRQDNGTPFSRL